MGLLIICEQGFNEVTKIEGQKRFFWRPRTKSARLDDSLLLRTFRSALSSWLANCPLDEGNPASCLKCQPISSLRLSLRPLVASGRRKSAFYWSTARHLPSREGIVTSDRLANANGCKISTGQAPHKWKSTAILIVARLLNFLCLGLAFQLPPRGTNLSV